LYITHLYLKVRFARLVITAQKVLLYKREGVASPHTVVPSRNVSRINVLKSKGLEYKKTKKGIGSVLRLI